MQNTSRAHFQTVMSVAILFALCVSSVRAEDRDPYLQGYHGPYHGRVIDAETKQPIAGAAVVAIWASMKEESSSAIAVFYNAREAVTDPNGEFLLGAEDIERSAPPQTLRPAFFIFYPGYGSFPDYQAAPQVVIPGLFEGAGTTVELPKLNTAADRLRVLGGLPPGLPEQHFPNLMQLVDTERANLKLAPRTGG